MSIAYACVMSRENFGAIASEYPGFNLEEAQAWIEAQGSGFFVRDEGSPFDCKYIAEVVFHQIYAFEAFDPNALFHRLIRR